MVVVLLLGASAAQLALQGEKAARAERDRHTAFQAAEEALMDAEDDIGGAAGRGALFAPDSALAFADACGNDAAGAGLGLCLRAPDGAAPVWQSADLAAADGAAGPAVPYGRYTGAQMQTGQGVLPFQRPRYIVELLPDTAPGEEAGAAPRYFYRVTAIGFGASPATQVVLQTFYRKPAPDGSGQ